jgi:hypothetical protein
MAEIDAVAHLRTSLGLKATLACALPPVAAPIVGAPGTVAAIAGLEIAEAGPVPTALVAITQKV